MKYTSYSPAPKGASVSLKTDKYIDYVLNAYMLTTEHKKKVDALVAEVTSHLALRKEYVTQIQDSISVKKALLADTRYEITVLKKEPTFFQSLFIKKDKVKESLNNLKSKEATLTIEINELEEVLSVTGANNDTDLHKHLAHINIALDNLRDKQKDLEYIKQGKYIQVPINTVRFLVMLSNETKLDLLYEKMVSISSETIDNIFLKLSGK